MKRKILITLLTVALLCGALLGAFMLSAGAEATPTAEEGHVHTSEVYVNGFRECCGAYQPAITVTNENYEALGLAATYVGYVAIENAGQLYWFAAEAEAGNHLNAVLLAHVTINDVTFALENGTPAARDKSGNAVAISALRKWTSIGKEATVASAYNKTFDGNGYEIRGLYCEESSDHVGLFGVASGFKIKNLGMINSCIVANGITYYTGSFVGLAYNGTLQNCYSNALIMANSFTGGIVGCPSLSATLSIYSCYYFGTMYASIGSSSFGSDYYYSCAIVSTANQKPIISNCYYLEGSSVHGNDGTKAIGAQDLTSGRLAFLLGTPYGQNIDNGGENAGHPTLDAAPVNYGYNSCDPTDLPLYSNAPITMEKAAHDFSVPLHDGSKACSKCQSYQRQHSSISAEYEESTDARQTHLIVKYPVTNPAAIRRDTAVITLNCSLTSHQDVTLGLFNGRVATKNGEELSFGAQNSVGYMGAELAGDELILRFAFFPASDRSEVGYLNKSLMYSIQLWDENGRYYTVDASHQLPYAYHDMEVKYTEEGAVLHLNFSSVQGGVIYTGMYENGQYFITLSDYYGNTRAYAYYIENEQDSLNKVTREDTANGTVIRIESPMPLFIKVKLPEGATGVSVTGNNSPCVTVTATAAVRFCYEYMDANGDTYTHYITVGAPAAAGQGTLAERLGLTTVDWSDSTQYALALDGVTKHRSGKVTVYLTNCVFKATGNVVCFTFTPGAPLAHTFAKGDILLIENGEEIELDEDVTVSLDAVLLNDHDFLAATCTEARICKYCGDTEGEALGHRWDAGTVTSAPSCTEQGVRTYTCQNDGAHTYTEQIAASGHVYDNGCDADCNTCGEARSVEAHPDADTDELCDVCGTALGDGGLSGGVIALIVVDAVALLAVGGFALFWFVIKKRKWSDFIALFEKQ